MRISADDLTSFFCQNILPVNHETRIMTAPNARKENAALIPLRIFFAKGSKWMGSFVGGTLAYFLSGVFTPDPVWISILTFAAAFAGWTTGTFLDINTYLEQRLPLSRRED